MTADKEKLKKNDGLDIRLGTPMKKIAGLSSDMKKSESEHLHAFRGDVNIGEEDNKDTEEDISTC